MAIQFQYPEQGWSTGKMRKRGDNRLAFDPDTLTDKQLKEYYRESDRKNLAPVLHGSEREFNIYKEHLKEKREETGEDKYHMSPKELREKGVTPQTLLGGGTKVAMDYQKRGEPQSALTEMEKAAGFGLAARGGAIPAVPGVHGAPGIAPIDQHKAQIQDAMNQVASGDMTSGVFKKLLKRLGWSGDHETGQFTDPTGQQHQIGGNGANGTRISQ